MGCLIAAFNLLGLWNIRKFFFSFCYFGMQIPTGEHIKMSVLDCLEDQLPDGTQSNTGALVEYQGCNTQGKSHLSGVQVAVTTQRGWDRKGNSAVAVIGCVTLFSQHHFCQASVFSTVEWSRQSLPECCVVAV